MTSYGRDELLKVNNWKHILPCWLSFQLDPSFLVAILSAFVNVHFSFSKTVVMLNICRLWTTRHFPISAAGRALDHQSIHLLTSTTASPLTILSTKNFTTISKSKRRAGSSSRWVHCTSAFPSQTQMTQRSSRSSRLSSRRSVSRMNPPTATRISMPQGWSSMDRLNRCRR